MRKIPIILIVILSLTKIMAQEPEHLMLMTCEEPLFEYKFSNSINTPNLKNFSINELKGQQMIVHFWLNAEGCDFCENELIRLEELRKKYDQTFEIIVITNFDLEVVNKHIKQYKIEYPIIHDSEHLEIFPYKTPVSLLFDQIGERLSVTYSTHILEEQIDRYIESGIIKTK